MNKGWWYRFVFFVFVLILSSFAVTPTLLGLNDDSDFPVKSKINLGLDLQGGLYIVLGIDFNQVYQDEVKTYATKLKSIFREEGVNVIPGELDKTNPVDPSYSFTMSTDQDVENVKKIIKEYYVNSLRLVASEGKTLKYGLNRAYKTEIENSAVEKSIEVIRNRIDEFGVNEPEIVSLGKERIVVQLPGVKDIERAKNLIGKAAKLEFRMVVASNLPYVNSTNTEVNVDALMEKLEKQNVIYEKGTRFSTYVKKANEVLKDDLPKNTIIAFSRPIDKRTNEAGELTPYILSDEVIVSGEELADAAVRVDPQTQMPNVAVTLTYGGGKRMNDISTKNVNNNMAIMLDGNIYSAPTINEPLGENIQITLGRGDRNDLFTQAKDLALVLRAGALPVDLEFQEQRIVGPSLGADSIAKAEKAGIIATILVFIFIIAYYKVSGVVAAATLIINLLIVLACLVGLEATLTLPGIAGIALTIGMAVDANIIIYERIKEELRLGTPSIQAMESGFGKAFWTILDANLTTAVAGVALINFGTGPIRGFAVTLLIGIIATVYSSYFIGRLLFELYVGRNNKKAISI